MRRRTLLQRLAGLFISIPILRRSIFAQGAIFSSQQQRVLSELASVVLPSALGKSGAETVAGRFAEYVRDYRPGADTDHGYGFTHVIPKPASPAALYAQQLNALPSPVTRAVVEASLQQAGIKELPRVPAGKSVIADLMAFYFRSSEANDLCYEAAIGRDQCRGLAGSDKPPAKLRRAV